MGVFASSRCISLQMESIQFGHLDRQSRYKKIVSVLHGSNASLSFPDLFKDQHQLKGFYRLINNKAVDHATFLSGYQSGLIAYSKECKDSSPWILVQDTMLTDFNTRSLDLGYTQTVKSNGFLLHHGLLLNQNFVPLGLLHQQVIFRERDEFGKGVQCRSKATENKESNKWMEGVETGIRFTEATGRQLIHVMDREADIVDVMNKCNKAQQLFVIRARHDRSTLTKAEMDKSASPELFRIFHLLPSQPGSHTITRVLHNEKGKEYQADCLLNYCSLKLRGINENITCVWIKEQQAEDAQSPAEWFLLTNRKVENIDDAAETAEIYSKRWTVEDFHKCYKTGCSIEKRQFDSRKALTTSIGLLAITAVVLLQSRYLAKSDHDRPFETIVSNPAEQELAKKLAEKYLKPVDKQLCQPFTVLWWLILIGRLGGHQGIKQKGLPGWQTLWKGYSYFQSLAIGYGYAKI